MKLIRFVLAFLAGALLASAVWGVLLMRCQIEMTANSVTTAAGDCRIDERVVSYIGRPDPATAHLLIWIASNRMARFPNEVDYWERRYPYIHVERRMAPVVKDFQTFLQTNSVLNAPMPTNITIFVPPSQQEPMPTDP